MTCTHLHKDAPENAVCEDCYNAMLKEKEHEREIMQRCIEEDALGLL